jgi:hypothetical protein
LPARPVVLVLSAAVLVLVLDRDSFVVLGEQVRGGTRRWRPVAPSSEYVRGVLQQIEGEAA